MRIRNTVFNPKFTSVDTDPYWDYGSGPTKLLNTDPMRIHCQGGSSTLILYKYCWILYFREVKKRKRIRIMRTRPDPDSRQTQADTIKNEPLKTHRHPRKHSHQ